MSNGTETLPLHTYKSGGLGENHLGVSVSQPPLSHPKGTKLSVFGHDIDITDFVYGQEDYDKSVMSYSHFLDVLFNGDKQTEYMPFPEAGQLENYAQLYLRSLNPYTMLLDKPTFTKLVRPRICDICPHQFLHKQSYPSKLFDSRQANFRPFRFTVSATSPPLSPPPPRPFKST